MTRCSEYKSWINSHSLSYLGRYRAALAAKKDQSRNRQPQQPLLGEARILWGDQRVGGPKKGHKCWTLRDFGSFCFLRLKVGDQNRFLGPGPKGSHILFKAMLIAIKHLWRSSLQSGETLRVIRSLPNPCIFPWQLFPTMRRPNRIKQKTILTYLQKFLALNQSQSSNLCQGSRQLSKKFLCVYLVFNKGYYLMSHKVNMNPVTWESSDGHHTPRGIFGTWLGYDKIEMKIPLH